MSCLQNFASDAFTFEAWVSTSDYCHRGKTHGNAGTFQIGDNMNKLRGCW